MASVTMILPGPRYGYGSPTPPRPTPTPTHRQATIVRADGTVTFTVPLLDSVGLEGIGGRWAVIDRPGREPITLHGGRKAPTASLVVVVGDDRLVSAEATLRKLGQLAVGSQPVIVSVGQLSRWSSTGTWAIEDMGIDPTDFVPGSNDIAVAEVTLALRAALTPEQLRGP